MHHVFNDRAKTWIPIEEIDPETMVQIQKMSALPFVFHHVAIMPDCHIGTGATVGTCLPTRDAVIPAAVGTDIGCGMIAARTNLTRADLPNDLSGMREAIEKTVPVSGRSSPGTDKRVSELEQQAARRLPFYDQADATWRNQLGTLGSGNHFIEVVLDENDTVWGFLNPRSRNIGKNVALHHIGVTHRETAQRRDRLPDPNFAYLAAGAASFDEYMADLQWAQHFALLNRAEMMEKLVGVLTDKFPRLEVLETIECHHNFSQWETHMGERVLVTRKGAIEARKGQPGLIPGSMGTRSYVVAGKGCAEAFNTAPHGAGRRMSRSQAKQQFTMEDFDQQMTGIESRRSPAFIDELPSAYKDIDLVMAWAEDLVEITHTFRQVVNVKGN